MVHITIVGAGVHGTRMAGKYATFKTARLKAVVSRHKPVAKVFSDVPFFGSASAWKKKFGAPDKSDVFDVCVHHDVLIGVLEDFIAIGAKNFILPKPVSLTKGELSHLRRLASRHKLNVLIASQWHYSGLVEKVGEFVKKNRNKISSVDVVFSRTFEPARKGSFTPATAFLPHILQILNDTGLWRGELVLQISQWSDSKIRIKYCGKTEIRIESDLTSKERIEALKIFLTGGKKPALVADFSGVRNEAGFIAYPSLTLRGKNSPVKEDVLENMIGVSLAYFGTGTKTAKALTLKKYLPIAAEEVRIVEQARKLVVVIGGGIFGALSALEIAKKGYAVVLLERASRLVTGASLVNQCRVHMGYHYPRDEKTARESLKAKKLFEKVFDRAIGRNVHNHYLIAREGGLTAPEDFLAFCKKLRLPYKEFWPAATKLSKEKIALSLKVPEPIFDADTIRDILNEEIRKTPAVALLTSANVTAIQKNENGYDISYESDGGTSTIRCAAIVNATYSNLNRINKLAGLPLATYQYELCEVPIARTPWANTGWAIMDGPFFGIMPFGFSRNHLLYDVELSVLERMVGELPEFKFNVEYYDDPRRRLERFEAYKEKWLPYAPEVAKCRPVASMYMTRIVLPKKEKTDSRPTMVNELRPGFWQMFSGKITTSVPQAIELSRKVDAFLKKR